MVRIHHDPPSISKACSDAGLFLWLKFLPGVTPGLHKTSKQPIRFPNQPQQASVGQNDRLAALEMKLNALKFWVHSPGENGCLSKRVRFSVYCCAPLVIPYRQFLRNWWAREDSNFRPPPCQGESLPCAGHTHSRLETITRKYIFTTLWSAKADKSCLIVQLPRL